MWCCIFDPLPPVHAVGFAAVPSRFASVSCLLRGRLRWPAAASHSTVVGDTMDDDFVRTVGSDDEDVVRVHACASCPAPVHFSTGVFDCRNWCPARTRRRARRAQGPRQAAHMKALHLTTSGMKRRRKRLVPSVLPGGLSEWQPPPPPPLPLPRAVSGASQRQACRVCGRPVP